MMKGLAFNESNHRLRIRFPLRRGRNHSSRTRRLRCTIVYKTLESGETIKRGCGRMGLVPCEIGWRCLYCGNYLYNGRAGLNELWFHFRTGREYWRASLRQNREFVNGVPVTGRADPLPQCLRADLEDPRPPKWFPYYLVCEEDLFQRFLETYRYGKEKR